MNIVILDAQTLGNDISLDEIQTLGDCTIYENTSADETEKRIEHADVVILNKIKLDEKILSKAKRLKLICVTATGYDNIDITYCNKNGIAVCNVVGYSSNSVAQVTLAMVLALSVNMREYTDFVESGAYTKSGVANCLTPVYHELFGKVWGIIGYGNIGRRVADVAAALGCKVIVNKQTPQSEIECVSLEELCKTADIITIHTPLTDATKGMINRDILALMKDDVILVNAARGAVTDEEAICVAIRNGKIGAFGTDVYSKEPFGADHPFGEIMHLPNVCLTPHMAWGALEARRRCISEVAENIKAFNRGEIRNRVDLL